MDTEKCRALLCALDTGTLARAAEQLGYTPSGISRMVASLEEQTGFPLLLRSRGGVSPTKECEALLPAMRQMLYHEASCRQTADQFLGLERGTITVGTSYGLYFRQLARLMARFRAQYPAVTFRAIEGTSSELTAAVNEHRADICIVSRRDDAPEWTPLRRDELLVMLASSHPLAARASVPLACLEEEEYIDIYAGRETDNSRCFARNHIRPKHCYTSVDDTFSAMAIVESGIGVTLMNAVIAGLLQGDVVFRPLQPPQYVEIGIITHAKEVMPPCAARFAAFVKENIRALNG